MTIIHKSNESLGAYVGPGLYQSKAHGRPIVRVEIGEPNPALALKVTTWSPDGGSGEYWTSEASFSKDIIRYLPDTFIDEMEKLAEVNVPPVAGSDTFTFTSPNQNMSPAIKKNETVDISPVKRFTGEGVYLIEEPNRLEGKELFRITVTPAGLALGHDGWSNSLSFMTPEQFAAVCLGRVIEPTDLRVKHYIDQFSLDQAYVWHNKQTTIQLSFSGKYKASDPHRQPLNRSTPIFIATFPDGSQTELTGPNLKANLIDVAAKPSEAVQALIDAHSRALDRISSSRQAYNGALDADASNNEISTLQVAIDHAERDEMIAAIELAIAADQAEWNADSEDAEYDCIAIYQYGDLRKVHHVETLCRLPIEVVKRLRHSYASDPSENIDEIATLQAEALVEVAQALGSSKRADTETSKSGLSTKAG